MVPSPWTITKIGGSLDETSLMGNNTRVAAYGMKLPDTLGILATESAFLSSPPQVITAQTI